MMAVAAGCCISPDPGRRNWARDVVFNVRLPVDVCSGHIHGLVYELVCPPDATIYIYI